MYTKSNSFLFQSKMATLSYKVINNDELNICIFMHAC